MIDKVNIRSYGRIQGRKLSERNQHLLEDLLPQLQISPNDDWQKLQSQHPHIWLEIGFGTGAHLRHIAAHNPNMLCIGAETFVNGIAFCLAEIKKAEIAGQSLSNIRIFPSDVRLLLAGLPDATLERVDILFPDPWHKRSQHKRRLINASLLEILARVMKQGAQLRIATDHSDYLTWILHHLEQSPHFKLLQSSTTPPDDWLQTRYQTKADAQGRIPTYLQLIRQ